MRAICKMEKDEHIQNVGFVVDLVDSKLIFDVMRFLCVTHICDHFMGKQETFSRHCRTVAHNLM